jgi:hypothetical protein
MRISETATRGLQPIDLKSARESAVEDGLEKMFGLALGFALLRAQALETTDDVGEFLLDRQTYIWN